MKRTWYFMIPVLVLLLAGGTFVIAKSSQTRPPAGAASESEMRNKVVRFVRDRFGVPDNITITADPLKPAIHPNFLQTTIVTDNGKEKHNNTVFVTQDHRLLIIGNLIKVASEPKSELVQRLREQFKIPATMSMTATDFSPSATFPNFLASTVTVDDGKQPQKQDFFMTRDPRYLVVGSIFNLTVDPRLHALRTINTANSPSLGPLTAPVTIVEFADLQCPSCGRMHEFLENEVLPKYKGKVRVVYKDFPIISIHSWTLTATVANQCVYQINPSAYVPFRSLVYKNQGSINATNVRELMISYGEQIGVDRLRLAACVDSRSSLPRIEASLKEAQAVGVQSTPTSFINGRMLVGMPNVEAYYKAIDEALRASK